MFADTQYYAKNPALLSRPIRSKTKTNCDLSCSHTFSRAWCGLHVFALSFDWFTGSSATVVIGRSNYLGFGFTTVNLKSL